MTRRSEGKSEVKLFAVAKYYFWTVHFCFFIACKWYVQGTLNLKQTGRSSVTLFG